MDSIFKGTKFLTFSDHKNTIPMELTPRRIPYVDLTLVIEGELHYECNGKPYTVKGGDAILFPTGSERIRLKTDIPASYASFNVQLPSTYILPFEGAAEGVLSADMMLMLETVKKELDRVSPYTQEKCTAIFLYLLHKVLERRDDGENPHVKRIKQYIHDHLSGPLPLDAIAKSVHLVPRYVCTLFKKCTDMTLTEFICRERVSLAKKLIVTSQHSLSEISTICGFTDYNYFSRTFKRITGVTAASYKKNKFKGV